MASSFGLEVIELDRKLINQFKLSGAYLEQDLVIKWGMLFMQKLKDFCKESSINSFNLALSQFINKYMVSPGSRLFLAVLIFTSAGAVNSTDVYFSEYHEPSDAWYNRYLEIYNGSSATIDLKDYAMYCKDALLTLICTSRFNCSVMQQTFPLQLSRRVMCM